jgi:phosphoenolpyruvate phosphomutase
LIDVEPQVAPLPEVFRLQGDDELEEAERRYLPAVSDDGLSAVVLAAAAGDDFAGLTAAVPKAMLKVQGRPILARLLDDLGHFGCRAVTVVRGYRAASIDLPGARFVDNPDFATTGEAYSLALAEEALVPGALLAFGDIVLKRHIVQALLEEAGEGITLSVDSALAGHDVPDRVHGSRPDAGRFSFAPVHLTAMGDTVAVHRSHGAWIGLLHLGTEGARWLREAIAESRADRTLAHGRISDLLTRVLARGRSVTVVYTRGGWVNVNNLTDLIDASGI